MSSNPSSVLALFLSELTSLSTESKRKHADVKEAADKSVQLIKSSPEQVLHDLRRDGPLSPTILHPLFLGLSSRNPKVVAISISAVQKCLGTVLFTGGGEGWPKSSLSSLLSSLSSVLSQGVEIQLKILQTLVALVGGGSSVSGDGRKRGRVRGQMLAEALLLCFRLQESKIGVVSSTAAATLRQLVMFIFDAVVEEDRVLADGSDSSIQPTSHSVPIPSYSASSPTSLPLYPSSADAYFVFSDLCVLINGDGSETPQFLELEKLPRTFGLELVESVVSDYGGLFKKHPELLLLLRSQLCPLLIRLLSIPSSGSASSSSQHHSTHPHHHGHSHSVSQQPPNPQPSVSSRDKDGGFNFALTLRLMRVIFLLLKHFSRQLEVESELFLRMFIRVVGPSGDSNAPEGSGGHPIGGGGYGFDTAPTNPSASSAGNSSGVGSSPPWMRVLALEIFRGLCGDFTLLKNVFERYDLEAKALAEKERKEKQSGGEGGGGSRITASAPPPVFQSLMTALNRLATERPHLLGTGTQILYGTSPGPIVVPASHQAHPSGASQSTTSLTSSSSGQGGTGAGGIPVSSAGPLGDVFGGVMDFASQAASSVGHVAVGAVGTGMMGMVNTVSGTAGGGTGNEKAGLSVSTGAMKLQCIDQLDKVDAPPVPETYIFLLALQCLTSIAEGFTAYTLSSYSIVLTAAARQKEGASAPISKAPKTIDFDALPSIVEVSKAKEISAVRDMADAGWPALLASLSFFMSTNLEDDLFTDVVGSLQGFTNTCGALDLRTPRDAFLTTMCKFGVPHAIVTHVAAMDATPSASTLKSPVGGFSGAADALGLGLVASGAGGPQPPSAIGLSTRNFATLKALLSVVQYLAGSLDDTWFAVFETLQNADYVIRQMATRSKALKRLTSGGGPGTGGTPSGAPPGRQVASSAGIERGNPSNFLAPPGKPITPSEAEEQAMQASITKLFESSRNLDDDAFTWFVGSLCRLSGEMLGFSMSDRGELTEEPQTISTFPGPSALPVSSSGAGQIRSQSQEGDQFSLGQTASPHRRRVSGMNTMRTMRVGEKSFGISMLGIVSNLNGHRLVYRDASVGWSIITSHLLVVQHCIHASQDVRIQSAEVLDQTLIFAPKNISTAGEELQKRIQLQVLDAVGSQAQAGNRNQTSIDLEIRRMALDTLFKILEANGDSFLAGWEKIFNILSTACPSSLGSALSDASEPAPSTTSESTPETATTTPPTTPTSSKRSSKLSVSISYSGHAYPTKSPVLVRTSFPSLQLICTDFLALLTVDELKSCVRTLGEFGSQGEDINVALTAGGLLWQIADHVQARWSKDETQDKSQYDKLWMYLLHQLSQLCRDARQEVRDGALQTMFRTVQMYGSSLAQSTWEDCMFEIIFPLLHAITDSVVDVTAETSKMMSSSESNAPQLPMASQPTGPPIPLAVKQWDDSKVLALGSSAELMHDFLTSKLLTSSRLQEIWTSLIDHLKVAFVQDRSPVAVQAMKSFGRVLAVDTSSLPDQEPIKKAWVTAWDAWVGLGQHIHGADSTSQAQLESFVRAVRPLQSSPLFEFDLERIHDLLKCLKAVVTYTRSRDYQGDVDSLSPVQAAVIQVIDSIPLSVPTSAAGVLCDLAEYMSLAFVAHFDAPSGTHGKEMHVSYIALSKVTMPKVFNLYSKFREDVAVYAEGGVERALGAFSIPLKLKYDCPAASKFGSDPPLWKTATLNFLWFVKICTEALPTLAQQVGTVVFEGIWRQMIESFRGALLADCVATLSMPLSAQQREENFDLALLASLEQDVWPHLQDGDIPSEVVTRLAETLQETTRLYELDLPLSPSLQHQDPFTPLTAAPDGLSDGILNESGSGSDSVAKETRFLPEFDAQAEAASMFGTTADTVQLPRERIAFWAWDLLFLMCHRQDVSDASVKGEKSKQEGSAEGRSSGASKLDPLLRPSVLTLPSLLNRCAAVLKTYIADLPLRSKIPFPRIREEELLYVIRSLLALRLDEGAFKQAFDVATPEQGNIAGELVFPKSPPQIASFLSSDPKAHLYHFYPSFCDLVISTSISETAPRPPPSTFSISASSASIASMPPYRLIPGLVAPPIRKEHRGDGGSGNEQNGLNEDEDGDPTADILIGFPRRVKLGRVGRAWPLEEVSTGEVRPSRGTGTRKDWDAMSVPRLAMECLREVGMGLGLM